MEKTKVIDNKPKNYYLEEHEMKSNEPSFTNNSNGISTQRNQRLNKINWKYIFFPILVFVLVGIVILVAILPRKIEQTEKNKNQKDISIIENPPSNKPEEPHDGINTKMDFKNLVSKYGPIEMEETYKINTNANDLKRIYINQKSYEEIKISGSLTKHLVDRKKNYDIYVISETNLMKMQNILIIKFIPALFQLQVNV